MAANAIDATSVLNQEWLRAQKIRRSLQHEVDRVKKCSGDGSEMEHFKKLDDLIAEYVGPRKSSFHSLLTFLILQIS